MSTQSTQYNAVQAPYDELRKTTIAIVERVNVRSLVLPLIKDANVLDLACGTGFYSRSFLDWGAKNVVGVDISSGMLAEARKLSKAYGDAISFVEADGSKPTEFEGGPFDLVFGAWFLNYASSKVEMVEFFRNIAVNLKSGARYIGVTPPPSANPAEFVRREQTLRPLPSASGGLYTTVIGDVQDGVRIHLHKDTSVGDLDFDCYHLRQDIWEAAAREAGFQGELKWDCTQIPDDFMEDPRKYGESENGDAGNEELETYKQLPHYGLLTVVK